ncbi:hypothetical protein [Halegenticoccus tardaugens]|uniref:hypothetical protein n=1 Tax=Halegenticoccus tardaugens TaxID=2071624 RepID=UPI00100B1E54|nr:hypothetical protein [Halegenticoccus tardaugens]
MTAPQDSVRIQDVVINDDFWTPGVTRNREVTIEYQYDQPEESGTLENFHRVVKGKTGGFQGCGFRTVRTG